MKVTVNKKEKAEVELTIEVPIEEVKPHVEEAAKRISKEVEIKGFRKGKVPYDVLAKHVGEATIYEEAFNAVVEATYPKALEQEKIDVIGRANIDTEKVAPGNPIVYKATAPLMPTITLGDYKGIKAKKKIEKLDEKKFEKTLDDLRRMRSKEKLVNREAKDGDKILMDFDVKIDNVPIEGGQGTNSELVLGSGQFIPGFEENIVGMKKGEKKTFEATFPKDYHKKDIAGKKAEVDVTLHEVYEIELPEITDEFAKEINFASAEDLKKELRSNLTRELEQQAQELFEVSAIKEIVEKSQIQKLSDSLLDDEANKMLHEAKHEIMQQGMKFEDYLQHIKKTEEEVLKDMHSRANDRLQAALVMRELAVAEDIKVAASEVDKELEEMKKLYEKMPEMTQEVDTPQQRQRLESIIFHKKVFERLADYTEGRKPATAEKKKAE
ncbi:MAG: trigger factor [Candidatus Kerfeldbacteria bacterium]